MVEKCRYCEKVVEHMLHQILQLAFKCKQSSRQIQRLLQLELGTWRLTGSPGTVKRRQSMKMTRAYNDKIQEKTRE